jgi:parallel beta-helix repeat protein
MKKLLKIILMILIVIVSVLLVLSLMSFKNSNSMQNFNSPSNRADLENITAPPQPNKPDTSTTTSGTGGETTTKTEFIFIDAKGTGDYKTLEEAVSSAGDGATIIMDSGTYTLAEGLKISKSINLIGKGPDKTIIIGEKGEFVIAFSSVKSRFFAEGIAFLRKGTEPGDIFNVAGGEASFNNCLFSGGKPNPDTKNWGTGLYYYNNSSGTASNCVAESNAFVGIAVEDAAEVNLINNISRKNAFSGISYYGSIGGYAIKNECYSNGSDGIQVQLNSIPSLINNKCHDNKYCGISFYDAAGGLAFQNECTKNQWGIYVISTASPTLEANIAKNNTKKDILEE